MRRMKSLALEEPRRTALFRTMAMVMMAAVTALYFSLPALAQTKYVITDGDSVIVCISNSSDPQVVIQEAGLELGKSDTYTTERSDGISEIHINRIQMIAVNEGDQMTVVGSYGGTVADVLASLDITLSPMDVLSCSLESETYDGMSIDITRVEVETLEYDEVLPHGARVYEDDSLAPDEELVLVEGADGLAHYTVEVTYENGEEVRRTVLSRQVILSATDALVLCGVDRSVKEQEYSGNVNYRQSHTAQYASGFQGTAKVPCIPGTNQAYTDLLYCTATAYTAEEESNITAIGTIARVGVVAVDPSVIPLGTRMYIVSADGRYVYGYCVAEDTGSAIIGNAVDLYFDDYDTCMQFGRQSVVVYILS